MKIAVISAFPPSKDNLGAPTALPYTILAYAPENLEVELYYFPGREEHEGHKEIIHRDIGLLRLKKACQLSFPGRLKRYVRWRRGKRKLPYGVAQFPPDCHVVRQINAMQPDLVWLYPHWLIDWLPRIRCKNIVMTGPDSAVLHSERAIRFGKWDNFDEIISEVKRLARNTRLEEKWGQTRARVHLVGQEDARKYALMSQRVDQAVFIRHPHHHYRPVKNSITESAGRLRVIITGGGETVYVGDHLSRVVGALTAVADQLSAHYEFLFIGSGYDEAASRLKSRGYMVVQKSWVDDYAGEISTGYLQLFPIAVGTGTKGKVLNALATGLLGIGSAFAFENIEIDVPGDVLLYQHPEDVAELLVNVLDNLSKYEAMAQRASDKVRLAHAPERVCALFWDWALAG